MAEYDWGAEVRAFRLRKKMKQEAVAAHLGVSQAYISRLEAGMVDPVPEVRERIEILLRTRENRPHFDHWLATVRHARTLTCLLRRDEDRIELVELSPAFARLAPPLCDLKPRTCLRDTLGRSVAAKLDELDEYGAFDGAVQCVEGLWSADTANIKYYFHASNVPVRDDLGEWYVHASLEPLSREDFVAQAETGRFPLIHAET